MKTPALRLWPRCVESVPHTQKLPDRMTLVCGVVETTHNYVEHPQVIAERLERAVRAVGDRERV
jgi:5-methyltetrahydropteroyltriglutamate--homocysteine methyltransferase